jgi:hypothetical protein
LLQGVELKFCILQHVRRAAVLALNTAAHNKPNLIKALLPELLPLLYDQTEIKVIFQSAPYFVWRMFLTGEERFEGLVYHQGVSIR